jgi:hypothetical protein
MPSAPEAASRTSEGWLMFTCTVCGDQKKWQQVERGDACVSDDRPTGTYQEVDQFGDVIPIIEDYDDGFVY